MGGMRAGMQGGMQRRMLGGMGGMQGGMQRRMQGGMQGGMGGLEANGRDAGKDAGSQKGCREPGRTQGKTSAPAAGPPERVCPHPVAGCSGGSDPPLVPSAALHGTRGQCTGKSEPWLETEGRGAQEDGSAGSWTRPSPQGGSRFILPCCPPHPEETAPCPAESFTIYTVYFIIIEPAH